MYLREILPKLGFALVCGAPPVIAGPGTPPPKPLSELKKRYDDALHYKSPRMIARTLEPLAAAAAAEKKKEWARRILKRHLLHKDEAVRVSAAKAYGVLALRGSSKDLRRFIDRRSGNRQPHKVKLAALESWGLIHDPGTYSDLLAYIKVPSHEPEMLELAVVAARGLARYRPASKYKRYVMLRQCMKTLDHIYGSAVGSFSAAAEKWWTALGPEMIQAFNELTGQELSSYLECQTWWRENRGRVKAGKA